MYKWWKDPERKYDIAQKISKTLTGVKRPRTQVFSTKKDSLLSVFKDQYIKDKNCLVFTGKPYKDGYGRKLYRRETRSTHRLAYELSYGQIKDNTSIVVHTCINKLCINPNHLKLITPEENRLIQLKRLSNRLTDDQKAILRSLYLTGSPNTIASLAKQYNISKQLTDYIINHHK